MRNRAGSHPWVEGGHSRLPCGGDQRKNYIGESLKAEWRSKCDELEMFRTKSHLLNSRIASEYHGENLGCISYCRKRKVVRKLLTPFCFLWGIFGISRRFRSGHYVNVIQYYFWEEICKSFPLFSEVGSGRITGAVNTLREVRSQAELEMLVLIPLVSDFCCSSCMSSHKWKQKESLYFPHGRGPAEQSSPFSCFW